MGHMTYKQFYNSKVCVEKPCKKEVDQTIRDEKCNECNQYGYYYEKCKGNEQCSTCCEEYEKWCMEKSALQVQLVNPEIIQVGPRQRVIFDALITQTGESVQYDGRTGEVYIFEPGTYYFEWWINTDSIIGGKDTFVAFELMTAQGYRVKTASNNTFGQVVGNAVLPIEGYCHAPMKVTIYNGTDGFIGIGQASVKANLVVVKLS